MRTSGVAACFGVALTLEFMFVFVMFERLSSACLGGGLLSPGRRDGGGVPEG